MNEDEEFIFHQINAINFLLKYKDKFHSQNDDVVTSEVIKSLVHKGIATANQHNQFKLKSQSKAKKFISTHCG